jgi:transposase
MCGCCGGVNSYAHLCVNESATTQRSGRVIFSVCHQRICSIFVAATQHRKQATNATMSVVGIDLGLQNSLIAAAGRGGVDVILNGNSNRQNP